MSAFWLLIGPPGAGKTTYLSRPDAPNRVTGIYPDLLRERLTGDPGDQTRNGEVWALAQRQAEVIRLCNRDGLIDATFTERARRVEWVRLMRRVGYDEVRGLWFSTPLDVCLERNRGRGRRVPEDVVTRMWTELNEAPPSLEEGFSSLTEVRT